MAIQPISQSTASGPQVQKPTSFAGRAIFTHISHKVTRAWNVSVQSLSTASEAIKGFLQRIMDAVRAIFSPPVRYVKALVQRFSRLAAATPPPAARSATPPLVPFAKPISPVSEIVPAERTSPQQPPEGYDLMLTSRRPAASPETPRQPFMAPQVPTAQSLTAPVETPHPSPIVEVTQPKGWFGWF